MMAAGGPVKKFNVGGITQADIDAYRQKLRGRRSVAQRNPTDAQIIEMIKRDRNRAQMSMPMSQRQPTGFRKLSQATPAPVTTSTVQAQTQAQTPPAGVVPGQTAGPSVPKGPFSGYMPDPLGQFEREKEEKETPPATAPFTQQSTKGSVQSLMEEIAAEEKEREREAMLQGSLKTGYETDPILKSKLAERMDIDPIERRTEAAEFAGETIDREGQRETYSELARRRAEKTAGIEAELKRLYGDPERNEREQYLAMLAGGAGGGRSLADFGRGMYQGRFGTRDKQRENLRANLMQSSNLLDKELEIIRQGAEVDRQIGSDMVTAGTNAVTNATNMINSATSAYAQLDATEQRNLQAESKRVFDFISDEKKNELKERELDILERGNEIKMEIAEIGAVEAHLNEINRAIDKRVQEFIKNDPAVQRAEEESISMGEAEAIAHVNAAMEKAKLKALQSLNDSTEGRLLLEQQEAATNALINRGQRSAERNRDASAVTGVTKVS